MKLRNKKTGEIIDNAYIRETNDFYRNGKKTIAVFVPGKNRPPERASIGYETLAELNKDWEDYEDRPYVIDMWEDDCICDARFGVELEAIERAKECGLYFENKEEAEKAVGKLKAWKRLKDKGFKFDGWSAGLGKNKIYTIFFSHNDGEYDLNKDLDLLFGGGK